MLYRTPWQKPHGPSENEESGDSRSIETNSPAVFNFSLLHVGDSFIPGEEFKIDPASLGVSDADGTSQLGQGKWSWYRHDASSVDASNELHAIGDASFSNYYVSDEDVGWEGGQRHQWNET